MHSITIENITDTDYQRLQWEAAGASDHLGKPLSIRNYARLKLGLSPAKRGSPHNNKGNQIKITEEERARRRESVVHARAHRKRKKPPD